MAAVAVHDHLSPASAPVLRRSASWLGRLLLLVGVGAALWLAGAGTAAAEEVPGASARIGPDVGASVDATVGSTVGPAISTSAAAAVPLPAAASAPVGAVATVVAPPNVDGVLDGGTAVLGSVVAEVRPVAEALPVVGVETSPIGLSVTPAVDVAAATPGAARVEVAAAAIAVALPRSTAAALEDARPALGPAAEDPQTGAVDGARGHGEPVPPAPSLPPAGDRAGSSSGGSDGGAADLTETGCGGPRGTALERSHAPHGAVRCVVLDPSFSPD